MQITRVLETCLYAENLVETATFYRDVLGLEAFSEVAGRHVFFHCADGVFLLFNPLATAVAGGDVPAHGAGGPGHVAFAIRAAELDGWQERLAQHGVAIEAHVTWPRGGRSLYVRDPAGNSVELAMPAIWGLAD